jgi:hypothetical protein
MKHLSEEDIVLLYFDESSDAAGDTAHLQECEQCREAYEELARVMDLTAGPTLPERGPEYPSAVWNKLQDRLPETRHRGVWWRWPGWAVAAATAAAALVITFAPNTPPAAAPEQAPNREAVMRMEVGLHLGQSERFLMEVLNSDEYEPEWAEELLASNRLLRQTAEARKMTDVAGVLEELEAALVEASHPNGGSPAAHFDGPEVLFRVRAIGARMNEQEISYATAF